jgi:DNA-binding transcriptional regulator YiaG
MLIRFTEAEKDEARALWDKREKLIAECEAAIWQIRPEPLPDTDYLFEGINGKDNPEEWEAALQKETEILDSWEAAGSQEWRNAVTRLSEAERQFEVAYIELLDRAQNRQFNALGGDLQAILADGKEQAEALIRYYYQENKERVDEIRPTAPAYFAALGMVWLGAGRWKLDAAYTTDRIIRDLRLHFNALKGHEELTTELHTAITNIVRDSPYTANVSTQTKGLQAHLSAKATTESDLVKDEVLSALPASPDPFAAPIVPFASNPVAYGVTKAFFQAPAGWPEDESGLPRYLHKVEGKMLKGMFSYHITLASDASGESLILAQKDVAREMLQKMGPDTAWLHMLLLAYGAQTYKGDKFVIPREAVYRVLGLDKRTDLTRNEKDARCFEEITRIKSIGIQIVRLKLAGKDVAFKRGIGVLWDIVWEDTGQLKLIKETAGAWELKGEDWQLIGRPGLVWGEVFLYGDKLRQFGHMACNMLDRIDRRRAPLSAGLAVQLVFENRFTPGEVVRIRNRDIIEFAGRNLNPADRREQHELKTQVLDAIAEQERWGWVIDYSGWPDDLRPDLAATRADSMIDGDGSEAAPKALPRGYWERFIDASTCFTTPAPLLEANLKAKQLPAPAPRTHPTPYTAIDLKETRSKLKWTQKETAAYLGVSQQMLSYMENGKREIKPEHKRKLEQALAKA